MGSHVMSILEDAQSSAVFILERQAASSRAGLQPPTTRGTRTICAAFVSKLSIRSTGLPGSTRKAVAPFSRSCAKIRSASLTAVIAAVSPDAAFCTSQTTRSSPRRDITRNMLIIASWSFMFRSAPPSRSERLVLLMSVLAPECTPTQSRLRMEELSPRVVLDAPDGFPF